MKKSGFLFYIAILPLFITSPLYAQFRVEVPYTETNGKLIIEVKVNGQKGRFLIDTGAPCCVTHSFSRKLNLSQEDSLLTQDSNGNILKIPQTTLQQLEISDQKFKDIQAICLEKGNMVETFGIDGVFGYTLMKQGIIKLNSQKHSLTFTDYDKGLGIIPTQGIPLLEDPYLTRLVVKLGRNRRDTVMFDSGAAAFYSMSTNSYKRLSGQKSSNKDFKLLGKGKGVLSLGIAGVEQNTIKYRLKVPSFRVGKSVFKNVTSITTDGVDSRIGSEILRYGEIIINYRTGMFYYLPFNPQTTPNLYKKEWDVVITVNQGYLTAGLVWDYAQLPLKGGERIIEIDGKRYNKVDLFQATTSHLISMPGNQIRIKYIDPITKNTQEVEIKRR